MSVLLRATGEVALVRESDDVIEVLNIVAECPPSIVFLAIREPAIHAWSVLRQVKGLRSQIRCCVVVQSADQERQARLAGADAVLQAGFSAETLDGTIRGIVASSAVQNSYAG